LEILTHLQKKILHLFSEIPDQEAFYLRGGTILCAFFLKHRRSNDLDTFDGAKPRFSNRGQKRRSVSTLSPSAVLGASSLSKGIPRALVLSAVEGLARGVEWVDFFTPVEELVSPGRRRAKK
jgi:hypothetical protein